MEEFKLLIDGHLVAGDRMMTVINPATEEPVTTECPRASADQANAAVAAAKAAFPAWAATPIGERRKLLLEMAAAVEARQDEIARLLTQEQGKPLQFAQGEVAAFAGTLRYVATLDLPYAVNDASSRRKVEVIRRPLGVVAAIVPWNFPVALMAGKLSYALLAGNTIVIKPAPTTPLASLRIGAIIAGLLPPGVVNIITDANDLGGLLTSHPDVRKVTFTGSSATGSKVMASSADSLKRVTLELGGNDAAIVLDDADPKTVAPGIFRGAFSNSGQVCIAIKRVYVHESIYDPLCDELASLAKGAIVDDGLKQGTQFGPLQNKMQFERVKGILEDAKRHGTVVAGGEVPDRTGYFIRPAIVRDIAEGARLVDEEQFGPVLPVIKYSDPDDAVRRANASPYGLGGSVWSSNPDRAHEIALKIESGTVWINKHAELLPDVPFAGAKASGVGVEHGVEGLLEFTQVQVINMAK